MIEYIILSNGDRIVPTDNQHFEQNPKRVYLWQTSDIDPEVNHLVKCWNSKSVLWICETVEAKD